MKEQNTSVAVAATKTETVSVFGNIQNFNDFLKMSETLSKSSFIPAQYKDKAADCLVALDVANRVGMNPLMVMQSLYVVKGKPSWSGQACIALVNGCGRFPDGLEFQWRNDDKNGGVGCRAVAKRRDGSLAEGSWITWAMVCAEGWNTNTKWQNMSQQMFVYRAATFFARQYCPEVLMGMRTEGEVEDENPVEDGQAVIINTKPASDEQESAAGAAFAAAVEAEPVEVPTDEAQEAAEEPQELTKEQKEERYKEELKRSLQGLEDKAKAAKAERELFK